MVVEIQEKLEILVMEYSGPMGKFFVRKQIKNTNKTLTQLNEIEKKELIKRIIDVAIYNENFKEECSREITLLLIKQSLDI